MTWRRSGDRLQVTNPSPYYLTFFNLKLNGRAITGNTMARAGERQFPLPTASGPWQPELANHQRLWRHRPDLHQHVITGPRCVFFCSGITLEQAFGLPDSSSGRPIRDRELKG